MSAWDLWEMGDILASHRQHHRYNTNANFSLHFVSIPLFIHLVAESRFVMVSFDIATKANLVTVCRGLTSTQNEVIILDKQLIMQEFNLASL